MENITDNEHNVLAAMLESHTNPNHEDYDQELVNQLKKALIHSRNIILDK